MSDLTLDFLCLLSWQVWCATVGLGAWCGWYWWPRFCGWVER